jgi:hypothetical protein
MKEVEQVKQVEVKEVEIKSDQKKTIFK